MPRVLSLLGILAFALVVAVPAVGGNWATIKLDEPPDGVVAGRPWRFGFLVKQHDVTPTNDVTPRLAAEHRESGEAVEAVGRQEGAEGHYVIEVTLPEAGEWDWSITPEPFPTFDLETLTVVADAGQAADGSGATSVALNIGARGHEVTMGGSVFSDSTLTIERGEAVVWRNDDEIAHSVVGDDRAFADSGLLRPGETFVQIFERPGVYAYHCWPHAGMEGTITVR